MSIRRRGKSSWEILIEHGCDPETGKRVRRWYSFQGNKRDAEEYETKLKHERDRGVSTLPSKMTVAELLQQWLEHVSQNRASRTYEGYKQIVERHLVPAFGSLRLAKLRASHIQGYLSRAIESGRLKGEGKLSCTTVHHHYAALHAALEYSVRMQLLAVNPAASAEAPRMEHKEPKALTEKETALLLSLVRGDELYIPILIAVSTGLRRGEVLGLKWADVDLKTGTLTVRRSLERNGQGLGFKEPKTKKSRRTIQMPPLLLQELKRHGQEQGERKAAKGAEYKDQDLVCARLDGQPWNPGTFSGRYGDLIERVGAPKATFHELRHTHCSQLLMQGVPLKVASERMGHAGIGITGDLYGHLAEGRDQAAAEVFDAALRAALAEISAAQ